MSKQFTHKFTKPQVNSGGNYFAVCTCTAIAYATSLTALAATIDQHIAGDRFPAAWIPKS